MLLAVLCGTASAAAQGEEDARSRWAQDRERIVQAALRARGASQDHAATLLAQDATVVNPLQLINVRFFPDSFGDQVVVGEVRNNTGTTMTFSRAMFSFYNGVGGLVGSDYSYVFGSHNARLTLTGSYVTALPPGYEGFFKVWTSLPASSIASYSFVSDAEIFGISAPVNSVSTSTVALSAGSFGTTNYSGVISSSGPTVAYFVQIALAGYLNGSINDVDFTYVNGATFVVPCLTTTTDTAIFPEYPSHGYNSFFLRSVNSIGNVALSWEESGVAPATATYGASGGSGTFSVVRACGWTATPTVPWITVTSGASGSATVGVVSFAVAPNPGTTARVGSISVSGHTFAVAQAGQVMCTYAINPLQATVAAGGVSGTVTVSTQLGCPWNSVSAASFVTIAGGMSGTGSGSVTYVVAPNPGATARSASLTIAGQTFSIAQLGKSPALDLNGDGRLDFLWQHQGDGRISGWLMNGTQLVDGTLLTPGQVADTNWKVAGTGDLDGDGQMDIVWQNIADGRTSAWLMNGLVEKAGTLFSIPQVFDTDWRIRSVGDLDGDGRADLFWQHQGDGRISVWLMDGVQVKAGVLLTPTQVADTNWKIVGTADFDGNGSRDLVWHHQTDGRIAIWFMSGTTLIDGSLTSPAQVPDTNWKIRAVGDLNSDGHPDFIWQNIADGRISVWLMNGLTLIDGTLLSPSQVSDTNWHIVGPR